MKRTIILFYVWLPQLLFAQSHLFERRYSGSPNLGDQARGIVAFSDNTYIITGMMYASGSTYNVAILKVDSSGSIIWNKNYGNQWYDQGLSIIPSVDNGAIICGITTQQSLNNNILLLNIDSIGNLLWSTSYGSLSQDDHGNSVAIVHDGGFLVSGYSHSIGPSNRDYYAIRTDSIGNILWSKTYGSVGSEEINVGFEDSDSSFVLCGFTDGLGAGSDDILIIKINLSGDTIWSKTIGTANGDYCYGAIKSNDDYYVFVGVISGKASVIKTDTDGNLIWLKSFSNGSFDKVVQLQNGNYALLGSSAAFTLGNRQFYLVIVDENGNLITSTIYGQGNDDEGFGITETPDSCLLLCGATFVGSAFDMYVLKTDLLGNGAWCNQTGVQSLDSIPNVAVQNQTINITNYGNVITTTLPLVGQFSSTILCTGTASIDETAAMTNTFNVFPNPTKSSISFNNYERLNSTPIFIQLLDSKGRVLLQKVLNNNEFLNIETGKILNGIYVVQIVYSDGFAINKKIIISN